MGIRGIAEGLWSRVSSNARSATSAMWRGFGGVGFDQMKKANALYQKGKLDEWNLADLRQRNVDAMMRVLTKLSETTDTFAHSISVKIVGGPAADLRRVYYLALATAFGRWGRAATRITGSYSEMSCHTDVTHKTVTVTIGYRITGLGSVVRQGSQTSFGNPTRVRTEFDVMHEGPDQVTVGAGWTGPWYTSSGGGYSPNPTLQFRGGQVVRIPGLLPVDIPPEFGFKPGTSGTLLVPLGDSVKWIVLQPEVLRRDPVLVNVFRPFAARLVDPQVLREVPRESGSTQTMYVRKHTPIGQPGFDRITRTDDAQVPILPDDGRIITTGETQNFRVQPTRPPVDGIARGGLVGMTVQALTAPGFLPTLPAITGTPLGTGGQFARQPGSIGVGQQVGVPQKKPPFTTGPIGWFFPDPTVPDPIPAPLMRDP